MPSFPFYFNQTSSGTGGGGGSVLATGTYAGDNTNDRTIPTGLSSPPKQVILVGGSGGGGVFSAIKTDLMGGKLTSEIIGGPLITAIAIVGNDFTVDSGFPSANAVGFTYFWTALT